MVTAAGMKSGFVIVDANGRLPVAPGETIRTKPSAGRLKIARVGKGGKAIPVEDVVAIASPKDGGDLVLLLDGRTRVVLDDFMKLCRKGTCDIELPDGKGGVVVIDGASHAIATGGDGSLLLHMVGDQATLSGLTDSFAHYYDVLSQQPHAVPEAAAASSPLGGINPLVAVAGLAAVGGVALAAGAGGGGSAHQASPTPEPTPTPVPTPEPTPVPTPTADSVIHISAAAGPISAALSYQVIGADGTILASGTTNAEGKADVLVSADYTGPILIRIMDANGTAADYSDEASGSALSLATDLRALAIKSGGDLSVSVTPLTELIARKLLEHQAGATLPDAATITEGTQAISQALGVDMSQGVVTVLDPAFNEADGISPAEAYGIFLAKLSGLDMKTGGIGATLDTLAANLTLQGSVAMLAPGGAALLQQGAAIFESGPNKGEAILIPQDEPLVELPSDPLLLMTVGGRDITELLHAGVFTLATGTAVGPEFLAHITLPENAIEGATIAVKAGDTVIGEWTVGLMDVVNGYADILLNTQFLSAPVEGQLTITAEITGMANARTASASLSIDTLAPPAPTLARDGSIVTVSNLQTGTTWSYSLDGGTSWTEGTGTSFTLAPGSYANGAIRARQTDQNGNASTAPSLAAAEILDTPPSVTIASDSHALIDGQSAVLTFTFSTVPVGFSQSDIVVQHATIGSFTQTSDPKVYTAILTPEAGYEGATTVAILADSWQSGSGTGGTEAHSQPIAIDTLIPASPTMTLEPTNGTVNVSGLDNGTTWFYSIDGGTSWTQGQGTSFTLAPGLYEDEAVRVRQVDQNGNSSTPTFLPTTEILDTPPSVTITSDRTSLSGEQSAVLTFTFSTVPIGFSQSDIVATHGSISSFEQTDNARVYTAVFTPDAGYEGTTTAEIPAGSWQSGSGAGGAAAQSQPIAIDTVIPAAPIMTLAADTGADPTDNVTSNGEIHVETGEQDGLVQYSLDGGLHWLDAVSGVFTVPEGVYEAYAVRARVISGGNISLEATMPALTVDTDTPGVTITSDKQYLLAGESAMLTLAFDDFIIDMEDARLSATGGTLSNLMMTPYANTYSVIYTPTAATLEVAGMVTLSGYHDLAGNAGASASQSFTFDAHRPAITSVQFTAKSDTSHAVLNAGDSVTITMTFDEDILVDTTGGSPYLTLFMGSGTRSAPYLSQVDARTLTFQYVIQTGDDDSDGMGLDGYGGMSAFGAIIRDAAGNRVIGDYQSTDNDINYRVDTTAPTLVSSTPARGATVGRHSELVFTFSEEVTPGTGTITLNSSGSGPLTISIDDPQVTFNGSSVVVNLTTPLTESSMYVVTISSGAILDPAGNAYAGLEATDLAFNVQASGFSVGTMVAESRGYLLTTSPTFADAQFGAAVAGIGDFDGDGIDDFIIGAPSSGSQTLSGSAVILLGNSIRESSTIAQDGGKIIIGGASAGAQFGYSVAAAGDVNGDGYDDLVIGSPGAGGQAGAYVLFGSSDGPFAATTSVEYEGTSDPDTFNSDGVGTTMMGRGGNDVLYMTGPDSVGYGGAGDDTFIVHPSFLGSLASPDPNAPRSSRIDGGSGIDTLKIALFSGNVTIDLRDLTSGSATVDGDGRMESIEIVDLLAAEGQNSLWVTEESIIAMSSASAFVDDGRVHLLVKGGLADTVNVQFLSDRPGFMIDGSIEYEGETYMTVRTDAVDLFVQQAVGIIVL
ncbi:Ig-like domain-containing protein [Aureimonas sp. OT7]|uniref:Ig-like domain-containing protein n=1 Tax=Aureimonas sp. OT7 TaxID=2816454 RepID=UPI001781433C|nr:Ig-like domain-containing protein [Aureimonas sp. OT7]QOG07960.1 Ig-like domain-containing protein [Aureimonas sp. OT7]